jgi:hypothetical protein
MARVKKTAVEGKTEAAGPKLIKVQSAPKEIRVANHMRRDVEFPMSRGSILTGHLTLFSGTVNTLDPDQWDRIKNDPIVLAMLKSGALDVVKSNADSVPVSNERLSNLEIPDDLKYDSEIQGDVSAKVVHQKYVE